MNLLLVERQSDAYTFLPNSEAFKSLSHVSGSVVRLGVPLGPRAEARVVEKSEQGIRLQVLRWEASRPAPPEVALVVGYPRPVEGQRILRQAAMLAVSSITFVPMDLTPSGYAESRIWEENRVMAFLREGLSQGYHTHLPEVKRVGRWEEAIEKSLGRGKVTVLDPYLGPSLLADDAANPDFPGTLVLGSERGFSAKEQAYLKTKEEIRFRHLGGCILTTQSALVASVALAHRQTGFWTSSRQADLANSFSDV